MMMTIPKDKYNELKPFYDFQRQKEFNKDWCRAVVQKVCNLSDGIIGYDEDSATELLWLHMKEEEKINKCILKEQDILYLPTGQLHKVSTISNSRLSLTIALKTFI